jgi:parvulin-like peptidyl-prolyl isomerase
MFRIQALDEERIVSMLKLAMIGLLAGGSLMAQAPTQSASPAASPSTAAPASPGNATGSAAKPATAPGTQTGTPAKPEASPAKPGQQAGETKQESAAEAAIPPSGAVITIHGICAENKPATAVGKAATTKTGPAKTAGANAPCTKKITKAEFDRLVKLVVPPNQPPQPALRRNLAQRYVELLAIANAAEKAGVEKTPEYALLRLRALTEAYQRELDEKYRNPPPAEVEAYYKQHQGDFESVTLRRIYVPKNDPTGKGTPEEKAAFTKKASDVADEVRDRAAKGEDLDALQKEVYSKLGLTAAPPNTQVGPVRKGALPPATEKELFALKDGGIAKIDEPTAFVIYKVEKKETLPMEKVKDEIARLLHRQKMEARLKEITSGVKADYNDIYFGPATPATPAPPGEKR